MYVDYSYYRDTYGGSLLSESSFAAAEQEAENYIRLLTYLNGDIFQAIADQTQADVIKGAVCAAAEACYAARKEQEQGGNLKSESKDGLSVSFVVTRKDGETVEEYTRRCMAQAIRPRLLPTGWLSRRGKVGCAHVHECGCCDNL